MTTESESIGELAESITSTFESVPKLVTAGAYIAGMAFAASAILKFKSHKDNPTQIPVSTPVALVVLAAALMFLPSIRRSSK